MTDIDTRAEAVERLAGSLTQSFPDADHGGVDQAVGMGEHGVDALVLLDAAATLRALLRERDEARALIEEMRAPYAIIVRREWQEGWLQGRWASMQAIDGFVMHRLLSGNRSQVLDEICDAIRAMPIPERPE